MLSLPKYRGRRSAGPARVQCHEGDVVLTLAMSPCRNLAEHVYSEGGLHTCSKWFDLM
jgi:hypothetical protein